MSTTISSCSSGADLFAVHGRFFKIRFHSSWSTASPRKKDTMGGEGEGREKPHRAPDEYRVWGETKEGRGGTRSKGELSRSVRDIFMLSEVHSS